MFGKKKAAPPKTDATTAVIALREQLAALELRLFDFKLSEYILIMFFRETHLLTRIEVTLTEAKLKASKKDKSGLYQI